MEKDSDLPETGTKGVGLEVGERLPGKGSIIETTERNLLHSIMQVLFCFMNRMTVASRRTLYIPRQLINKGGPTKTLFSGNFADNWLKFVYNTSIEKKVCRGECL